MGGAKKDFVEYLENRRNDIEIQYLANVVGLHTTKLETGLDPGQSEATWALMELLKGVQQTRSGLFPKVACLFVPTIPYLKVAVTPEVFRDSYRGTIWLLVILLESEEPCIKEAVRSYIARNPDLSPYTLDRVFRENENKLSSEAREDLVQSMARLKLLLHEIRNGR